MNETMNTILTRRSIRKFQNKPIPKEDLDLILQAALHAPSAKNLQTWQFTVVQDREKIQQFATVIREVLDRKGYDMHSPQVLIIPSNEEESPYGQDDNACAMENIFLAAHSLGIGSVWINQITGISREPRIREVLRQFGVPDSHVVFGMAALGYPVDMELPEKVCKGKIVMVE